MNIPVQVDLLVENVVVYSGSDKKPFIASVAIRDGKFIAVGPPGDGFFAPTETIDGTGKFMAPGLWDAHVHIRSSKERGLDIEKFVEHGVTSIHDLGGYIKRVKSVERDLANGITQGPSIYSAYFMLNGESFADYQHAVTSQQEIEDAIDDLASAGAAQIKIHRALSPEMLPVVTSLAHERGLPVTGHIPLGVHPLNACETGMDRVEHVGSFAEALISVAPEGQKNSQLAIQTLLSEAADSIYECFASRNVFVTPTLIIYPGIARRRASGAEIPPEFLEFIESMKRITYRLYESGVPLLAGTDASDYRNPIALEPGKSLLDEMVLLQEAGVPPVEIIAIASLNAARSIGVDKDTGSIDLGKDADFLLLSADPGEDVWNFQSIDLVFQMGRVVFSAHK